MTDKGLMILDSTTGIQMLYTPDDPEVSSPELFDRYTGKQGLFPDPVKLHRKNTWLRNSKAAGKRTLVHLVAAEGYRRWKQNGRLTKMDLLDPECRPSSSNPGVCIVVGTSASCLPSWNHAAKTTVKLVGCVREAGNQNANDWALTEENEDVITAIAAMPSVKGLPRGSQ